MHCMHQLPRRMNTSKKKVTFNEQPVYLGSGARRTDNHTHSGILQHYYPLIVENLSLTSSLYRKLKENGILTNEQIGLIEIEESQDRKVSKLLGVLKNADHYVFTTFCAVLHETGHRYLAHTLQKATRNKRHVLPAAPLISQPKTVLKEIISRHRDNDRTIKEENLQMRRKIHDMRRTYLINLQELEERIAVAKWKGELAIKEQNIIWSENEALQNLNSELRALIRRLQEATSKSNIHHLGFSVDFSPPMFRRLHPGPHLSLPYR
ncbi:uncharacterized protein LOC142489569 isoform X1 [Ascaphus truei]|uniref:uncharacterized protein LOC142489569 isoform X1 n=1 Tax=Ascaphus truei TaxID=8439 RepID=UPI003F5A2159